MPLLKCSVFWRLPIGYFEDIISQWGCSAVSGNKTHILREGSWYL
jgi:hypothetical protein